MILLIAIGVGVSLAAGAIFWAVCVVGARAERRSVN
jgi:hypothetical protein